MLTRCTESPALLTISVSAFFACGDDSPMIDGHTSSGETSSASMLTEMTSDAAATAQMTAESSGTSTSASDISSTETGVVDECPAPDPTVFSSGAIVLTNPGEWPEGATLDAVCDAVTLDEGREILYLTCAHPETRSAAEVRVRFSAGSLGAQLDDLPGTSGLQVSFWNPPAGSINCGSCSDLSIRDAADELIVLSFARWWFETVPEGGGLDVKGAGWLEPGSPEYETWSEPFDDIRIRNVGCAPRASLRPGSETETPLAFEFVGDAGVVAVYDRNLEAGVQVDGAQFDVNVSDAFFRGPLTCGDCAVTEGVFLILRSGS